VFVVLIACTNAFAGLQPKGLMLNLDFEAVSEGLIPSKAMHALHVPVQDLGVEFINNRHMLAFQDDQGLDIPHSSLLDPNGDEWIVSVRAFPLTDGIIFSQTNDKNGLVIYMQDGHILAAVRTGNSTFILKERENRGLTKYRKRWVTIEIRIKKGLALMSLNRERVAMVMDQPALDGENLRIRLGEQRSLPPMLNHVSGMTPVGFTGAITSLKILRQ